MREFFQFSVDILDWRFFLILTIVSTAGLTLPAHWTQPFRSVRFNIWLFSAVAVASAAGTFLPTAKQPLVYHSWWFSGMLALLAFDVVVCKLRGLPKIVFGPPRNTLNEKEVSLGGVMNKAGHRDELASKKSLEETVQILREWLKTRKYQFQEASAHVENDKKGILISAGRHYFQRWGDFILHVSLVIVLSGSFLGALVGYEEAVPVLEGQTARTQKESFEIFLKDFEIDYYKATGVPSLYASDIVVSKNGRTLGTKRIVVNDPLDIQGVRFYQASWGMSDQFRSARLHIAGGMLQLLPGVVTRIPQTPLQIRANTLYPTFDVDEHGHATTRDFEGRNMALQLDFLEKDKVVGRVWILKERPDLAFRIIGDRVEPTNPPPFRLVDVEPILFSGIQVGYDPGAPIFWVGVLILLFGLCTHFYLHQRRLRIVIFHKGKTISVAVGGWNSRSPYEFNSEFMKGMKDLRMSLS